MRTKAGSANKTHTSQVVAHQLADDGIFPNSRLPLMVYKSGVDLQKADAASKIESILDANGAAGRGAMVSMATTIITVPHE